VLLNEDQKDPILALDETTKNWGLGNSLKKASSMPNLAFVDYEFGIKSLHLTILYNNSRRRIIMSARIT